MARKVIKKSPKKSIPKNKVRGKWYNDGKYYPLISLAPSYLKNKSPFRCPPNFILIQGHYLKGRRWIDPYCKKYKRLSLFKDIKYLGVYKWRM